MKKKLLMILSFLLTINLFGQNNLKICREKTSLGYFYYGIFFWPIKDYPINSDSILCDNYKEEFYLNGLKISKKTFLNLKLSSKHLRNDSTTFFNKKRHMGYGTYEYHFNRGSKCAGKIIYRMDTKLPVYLNGKEIENPDSVLKQINPDDVISIVRKTNFWGKSKIEIKTIGM